MGICNLELRQFAKAHRAFNKVIRDQNRIPPAQYNDIMQRSRYFWALTWTKLYKASQDPDKKAYFKNQASMKWSEYQSWFGSDIKYQRDNKQAMLYIESLN